MRSSMPMVCASFVVACFRSICRVLGVSCITSELNCDPMFDIFSVGRYACLVTMSVLQRPTVCAVMCPCLCGVCKLVACEYVYHCYDVFVFC